METTNPVFRGQPVHNVSESPAPAPGTPTRDPVAALPPLREIIAQHGLAARRSLGQHFLLDLELTRRIARAAGDLSQGTTIEIGPGPGGLTRALLIEGAAKVIAIERDERCVTALETLVDASRQRLEVLHEDALTAVPETMSDTPRRIVANLPYNIAMPLLMKWLDHSTAFSNLILMFQREVAERIVAQPGSRTYGRPSVMVQWHCSARRLFDLPARAFVPPPKVVSSVIMLTPFATPPYPANKEDLKAVTAAAFGQRRKMLRTALKSLPVDSAELLDIAEVDPTARAETLEVAEFAALARALTALREGP